MLNRSLKREEDFRNWLLMTKKISKRVSGDYVSRCKRVQSALDIELDSCFKSKSDIVNTLIKLNLFAENYTLDKKKSYILQSNLWMAVRYYIEFSHNEIFKDCPRNNHRQSR